MMAFPWFASNIRTTARFSKRQQTSIRSVLTVVALVHGMPFYAPIFPNTNSSLVTVGLYWAAKYTNVRWNATDSLIILGCVANFPCPIGAPMAIHKNGSATTVHLALAESASKNGKPPKWPKQKRPNYGSKEKPRGASIREKWHSSTNNWRGSRFKTTGRHFSLIYTISELRFHANIQLDVCIRDS